MLVVTRSENQSVMIGTDIVVTVLEVRGDQVRIGIQAPREVSIQREAGSRRCSRRTAPRRRRRPSRSRDCRSRRRDDASTPPVDDRRY
ncbi:MAG: carbon storage regulator [Acidimicrobiia bacterium]